MSEFPPADDGGFVQWAGLRRARLRHTAYLLCGDWQGADDLVQETLTRVYLRWRRIAAGKADAYARRVLATTYVDDRRRTWRREVPTELTHDGVHIDPSSSAGSPVIAALRDVPPRQRAVLILRFWEDLSLEQTADVLGCTVGTVKSQSARGLAKLRELLPDVEENLR